MLKSLCRLKRIQTARGLEFVADVAEAESCPVDADIFSECDDFKQFAHFMLVNQFLNSGGFTDIGCRICLPVCANSSVMPRFSRKWDWGR